MTVIHVVEVRWAIIGHGFGHPQWAGKPPWQAPAPAAFYDWIYMSREVEVPFRHGVAWRRKS